MHTTNNSAFSGAICALVIIAFVVSGCGRFGSQPEGGVGDLINQPIPSVDPSEPFPALSTSIIDALITELPELRKHRDEILNAERTAISGVLEDVRANSRAANGNFSGTTDGLGSLPGRASLRQIPSRYETRTEGGQRTADVLGHLSFTRAALAAAPEVSSLGPTIQSFLIGHQIGFSTPDFEKVFDADRGQTKTVPVTDESTGTVLATTTISVRTDGSVSNELSTKISLPNLGLDANSRVKLTGNQCPNSEGKLDLTVEHSSNGRAGSSGTIIYDKKITARIKASVNDDAELAGIDLDLKQATRSAAGGRQVYVETSQSGQAGSGSYRDIELGDLRIDRASSQATSADQSISEDGLKAAYSLAQGVLENAKERWKEGGCVKIDAPSPGNVALNSTTQIPVKVVHKFDGADVPSKLEVTLKGEESVSPTSIAKTAGTLTYVAPGEKNKNATIGLTATSRRGRATLDLSASTGGNAYRVNGVSNSVTFEGQICSLTKQFIVDGKFPGGSATTSFMPNNELGGITRVAGGGGGCEHTGDGRYTVTLNDDGSGTLTWTTSDKIACPGFSNSRTATFTLPLVPAPDLSCP